MKKAGSHLLPLFVCATLTTLACGSASAATAQLGGDGLQAIDPSLAKTDTVKSSGPPPSPNPLGKVTGAPVSGDRRPPTLPPQPYGYPYGAPGAPPSYAPAGYGYPPANAVPTGGYQAPPYGYGAPPGGYQPTFPPGYVMGPAGYPVPAGNAPVYGQPPSGYPPQQGYQPPPAYPAQGSYPSQSAYPTQQSGNPNQQPNRALPYTPPMAYPTQTPAQSYPSRPAYPPAGQGYGPQSGYAPPPAGYGSQPAYGAPQGYAPQPAYPPQGQGYPSQPAPPSYQAPAYQQPQQYPSPSSPPSYQQPSQGGYRPTQQPVTAQGGRPGGYPPDSMIPEFNKPLPAVPRSAAPVNPGGWATNIPTGPPMSPDEQRVTKLEQTAFGSTYPEHEVDDRVDHLEKEVFGNKSEGSIEDRLSRLETKLSGGSAFSQQGGPARSHQLKRPS